MPLQQTNSEESEGSAIVQPLRSGSPVQDLPDTAKESEDSVEYLLNNLEELSPRKWRDRAAGFRLLSQMELNEEQRARAEGLVSQSISSTAMSERTGRLFSRCVFISVSVAAITSAIPIIVYRHVLQYYWLGLLLFIAALMPVSLLVFPCVWLPLWYKNNRSNAVLVPAALSALYSHGGPESIAVLYNAFTRDRTSASPARIALMKVLRLTDDSWYGRLSKSSRQCLSALAALPDVELAMSAIDAIEAAGDGSATVVMQKVIDSRVDFKIRTRAGEALPILIKRRELESTASALLRPSDVGGSDSLVRAVCETESSGDSLLRPVGQDDSVLE